MKLAIITVSDSVSKGAHADTSGDALEEWAIARGDRIVSRSVVSDESVEIVRALVAACDAGESELVLTTGGTGFSKRDVTPEATRAVIDAEAQGFGELMRAHASRFPRALLSRGVAGVRNRTLIVNLPGSPAGVRDGLAILDTIVDHACDVLTGRVTQHGGPDGAK